MYKGNLPLIDPIKDMKINDEGLEKTLAKKAKLEKSKEELQSKFEENKLQVNTNAFIQCTNVFITGAT